jgi:thermitase
VIAVGRGASVANLSLGLPGPSCAIQAAVDYARAAGTVVVAAAGNADAGQLDFPAAYAPVIAVAGTDPADRKATFSDYGVAVDVAAPAVGILSTYWDGTYSTWSGTSMAAPFASGIAALAYGILGTPTATNGAAVETLVRAGALPLAAVDPVYGSLLGAGRVSAAASLRPFMSSGWGDEPETDLIPLRLGR